MAGSNETTKLGFLTVMQEGGSYVGGYLVTNQWGRPLEFRLTSAVQPNKVQKILYAGTMKSYICSDLIGKTLIDKAGIPICLVVTDTFDSLDLRHCVDFPVAWIAKVETLEEEADQSSPQNQENSLEPKAEAIPVQENVYCHPRFSEDAPAIQEIIGKLTGGIDLSEPFQRIREAMAEARKLNRAA